MKRDIDVERVARQCLSLEQRVAKIAVKMIHDASADEAWLNHTLSGSDSEALRIAS